MTPNKDLFIIVLSEGSQTKVFGISPGPGGFRELREAYRKHFHLSWYLCMPGITSYSHKPSWGDFFIVHGSTLIFLLKTSGIKKLGSNVFITASGRHRKVEEV